MMPTNKEAIEKSKTPPAAASFAILASSLYSGLAKSTIASKAVLKHSPPRTSPKQIKTISHSIREIEKKQP